MALYLGDHKNSSVTQPCSLLSIVLNLVPTSTGMQILSNATVGHMVCTSCDTLIKHSLVGHLNIVAKYTLPGQSLKF